MEKEPKTLRIASYNIYKGRFFAPDGARRGSILEDIGGLASLSTADVLALQEAVVGPLEGRSPDRDTVAEVAAAMGIAAIPKTHVQFAGGPHGRHRSWGVGLVTRQPARFMEISLPRPLWSPWHRWALLAETGPWIVGTLHLEVWPLGAPARRRQMRTLLAALDQLDPQRIRPTVLAGDLNCQSGGPHEELARAGFVPALDRHPTFRFAGLRLHLDHVYVRGARVHVAGVLDGARGSDHLPVWAEVSIRFP